MPNRIIKESICTSPNLDVLSANAEVLFYRLIVNCDDYGRLEYNGKLIRSRCFPLKIDQITDAQIEQWLQEIQVAQLVKLYAVDGRFFLQFNTWERHQQIRAKRSKYPSPNGDNDSNGLQVITDDNKCPRNPIQSNPNPIPTQPPSSDNICNQVMADKDSFSIYENNIGQLTPAIADALKDITKEYKPEWFEEAVKEACLHNARNLKYITAILENWKVKGFKANSKTKTKSKFKDGWK